MVKTIGQGWKIGEGSDLRIAVSRLETAFVPGLSCRKSSYHYFRL